MKKKNIGDVDNAFMCGDGNLTIEENCIIRQTHLPEIFNCENCGRKMIKNKGENKLYKAAPKKTKGSIDRQQSDMVEQKLVLV